MRPDGFTPVHEESPGARFVVHRMLSLYPTSSAATPVAVVFFASHHVDEHLISADRTPLHWPLLPTYPDTSGEGSACSCTRWSWELLSFSD
jgi:hypothetical protein